MSYKIVILAGPSGGGKTFKEKELCDKYEDFNKLEQVTTREMRENESQGNPYIFITKDQYKEIEDMLVGKTIVNENFYGTLFKPKEDIYNTVILNKLGIDNFVRDFENSDEIHYIIVMIDSDKPAKRSNRDIDFINNERKEISNVADIVIKNNPPKFSNVEDIRGKIDECFRKKYK